MRLFGRTRRAVVSVSPVDDDDDDLDLDDEIEEAPPAPSGPVMLTLTTREKIEQAAEVDAAPKVVRVRPGRGAFTDLGGPGGAGCAHPH